MFVGDLAGQSKRTIQTSVAQPAPFQSLVVAVTSAVAVLWRWSSPSIPALPQRYAREAKAITAVSALMPRTTWPPPNSAIDLGTVSVEG